MYSIKCVLSISILFFLTRKCTRVIDKEVRKVSGVRNNICCRVGLLWWSNNELQAHTFSYFFLLPPFNSLLLSNKMLCWLSLDKWHPPSQEENQYDLDVCVTLLYFFNQPLRWLYSVFHVITVHPHLITCYIFQEVYIVNDWFKSSRLMATHTSLWSFTRLQCKHVHVGKIK